MLFVKAGDDQSGKIVNGKNNLSLTGRDISPKLATPLLIKSIIYILYVYVTSKIAYYIWQLKVKWTLLNRGPRI